MPGGDGMGPAWAKGNWNCMGRRGRGIPRYSAGVALSKEEEKEMLNARLQMLKSQTEYVTKRLAELSS